MPCSARKIARTRSAASPRRARARAAPAPRGGRYSSATATCVGLATTNARLLHVDDRAAHERAMQRPAAAARRAGRRLALCSRACARQNSCASCRSHARRACANSSRRKRQTDEAGAQAGARRARPQADAAENSSPPAPEVPVHPATAGARSSALSTNAAIARNPCAALSRDNVRFAPSTGFRRSNFDRDRHEARTAALQQAGSGPARRSAGARRGSAASSLHSASRFAASPRAPCATRAARGGYRTTARSRSCT